MNSKQLVFFLKVVELSSIAAAARELNVAQPSISLQLANLEHELKTTLFERSFRGVSLTQSGNVFKAHAESLLRQIEQAKSDVQQLECSPSGSISIGMTQPIGNIISVPLLTLVEQRYPDIELKFHTGFSYSLSKQLDSGEIDIAISSPDSSDNRHIKRTKLFREKIFLAVGYAPKTALLQKLNGKKQITFEELADYDVIVTGVQDSLGYALSQYEEQTSIKLKHKPEFGQLMTTLRYVVDGYGVLLSPTSAFYHLQDSQQIQAIEVVEPTLWRDVYLFTSTERPRTTILQIVQSLIEEIVEAEWRSGAWKGELPVAL
ncbi:LysR family transcriptional regulator [Marinomonas arenicola]|uniref:LysR family transcriptional regulator n=1 Tax=Marinomonas arenicola TaxID=569601 RepID=A0ABU9G8W6_9GAMM